MITPAQIRDKADRLFEKAVKTWLSGEIASFFPYRIPANLTPAKDHAKVIAEVESLRNHSKPAIGYGYSITWQSRRSRTHGLNDFPTAIVIESMNDLARLAGRDQSWQTLEAVVGLLRDRQPLLEHWLRQKSHWKSVLELADALPDLLGILDYFIQHPRPDCFARELPIPVSTKLIETHRRQLARWLDIVLPPQVIDVRFGYDEFEPRYGLRYARPHYLLRVLDKQLQSELGLPFDELSLPAESLDQLPVNNVRVIIVENKVSLLAIGPMPRTLALGGLGNGVTQLSGISWLRSSETYYWGDLDADGFLILDRLRQVLPRVQSVMMNEATANTFVELETDGNFTNAKATTHLNQDERLCYERLCQTNRRIEQEHLPMEAFYRHV